ncbi:MAG: hypothetical protein Q7U04_05355 [Bacteriovorax sp.]|nr:hypothetical protein [Bacteriovorax sp.]
MKSTALILISISFLLACGKTNRINTAETSGINNISNKSVANFSNFEGTYDLIRMDSNDCGASIQIVRDCDGLMLLSNHLGPEEFCNINKGEFNSTIVTLSRNELKSTVNILDNGRSGRNDPRNPQGHVSFTNTLTLNSDNTLVKISNLKSRMSRCIYLKR